MLLETGDYILGKNTAVERKTISDFILSLNSGRLYLQARMMTFEYKNCYLLIEFLKKPCLSDYFEVTDQFNFMQKFLIFIVNFPRIKIIWSNNELLTLKIFRSIQKKKENFVDIKKGINPILLEILLSIPGVEYTNYKNIINVFNNVKEIALSPFDKLTKAVGQANGKKIFDFFNHKLWYRLIKLRFFA